MSDTPEASTAVTSSATAAAGARVPETRAAVHDLLALVGSLEERFLAGDRALPDDTALLESYKWMFSILHVGLEAFVWGQPDNPRFVEITSPGWKWGGDNSDAFYQFAPVSPARTYRVTGVVGDAVYWSLTVYGGPDDGRYSERIVGSLNGRDLPPDTDGIVAFTISADPFDGPGILLDGDDAVAAITRDYLPDPTKRRRMTWQIEAVDPPPTVREDDADLARRFRSVITWVREQADLVPIALGEPNHIDPPYPVPTATFGWAAGDAAYAMGSFSLGDGEALVIDGRSPYCVFWNLCLWNQLLHTFDYRYERVTINGTQVRYEPDGSWRIVVAHRDPGHPNWVSTQGHHEGLLWFRWFLPDETPSQPSLQVVPVEQVATLG